MFRSYTASLLFLLLLSSGVAAQLPDAPSAVQQSLLAPVAAEAVKPSSQPRVFDRSFKIWVVVSFAATIADIESTQYGIAHCNAIERNPLLGWNGGRARMYAVGLPITAGYNLLGYWIKKKYPDRKVWALMPGMLTGVHAGAAAHNWAVCH